MSEFADLKLLKNTPLVASDTLTVSDRVGDVYREFTPDKVISFEQKAGRVWVFRCENSTALEVIVLTDNMVRIRYAVHGTFERDFSYAVNPDFDPLPPSESSWVEKKTRFELHTGTLEVRIEKKGAKVHIYDRKGKAICKEAGGFYARSTILNGMECVGVEKEAPKGEHYFGLGDKSCSLNLRGQKLENWNTDAFGYGFDSDPLYKTIPFYYGLHKGTGYGIFMDNSFRSRFYFDPRKNGKTSFSAEGGELRYYFIFGPSLMDVASQYTQLTGVPELPPLWALGFHQCRWSYYPEQRVRNLAAEFRKREIPCDAIYLDIDYMDGFRVFTWDHSFFPNPTQMISDLKDQGFQTVVMIDPGIKADPGYEVYEDGLERGLYCKRTNGELMIGPVWPQECVFPDFTRAEARQWFGDLYRELYLENGVSGFWNDMNEPAVFKVLHKTFPDGVIHDYEGDPTNHKKAHNIYGLQMTRATYNGLKRIKPEKRPFVLTRATFSGGQRYSSVWTGDNVASWDHLKIANRQMQRLSLVGFSFSGSDIGGFNDQPSGELYVRWLQLGAFHPFFRVHSMGNNVDGASIVDEEVIKESEKLDRLDQEPWAFGEEVADLSRQAIELRYRMLPYIYTTFWQYVQNGVPMLRSLIFFDQQDEINAGRENEFLFGDHLLVVPVLRKGAKTLTAYLPKGNWYDYWSGDHFAGGEKHRIKVQPDRIPLFVKEGAILPQYPVMQHTLEKEVGTLTLKACYADSGKLGDTVSILYEDAGEGYQYRDHEFLLQTFSVAGGKDNMVIRRSQEGTFAPSYSTIKLEITGLPFIPQAISADGQEVEFRKETFGWTCEVPAGFTEVALR